MILRAVAFVLGWVLVVPPILGVMLSHLPALKAAMPGPDDLLKTWKLITLEIILVIEALLLSIAVFLTEGRKAWAGGVLARFAQRTNLAAHGRALAQWGAGAALGGIVFALLMAVLLAAGAYHISLTTASFAAAAASLAQFAMLFTLVGVFEEFAFRGYLQKALDDGVGFWTATAITSLLFGVAHFSGIDTLAGSAGTVIFGVFACLTLRATGSLWFVIGWHGGWDFTETALFGTPNGGVNLAEGVARSVADGPAWLTGGAAGPEGSVLCAIVMLLTVVAALRLGRRA
jgi:membrane protease YdiL (CAAX protease family)